MSLIPWIIVTCWAAFIVTWTVLSFNVKRDINRSKWWRWWWFRIVVVIDVFVLILLVELLSKRTIHFYNFKTVSPITDNPVLLFVAALLSILGVALAIWARLHLGRNWSPVPAVKEEHELVTSGPYKLIRHPIYTGIIMAVLGSSALSSVWLGVFVVCTCVFVWRVKTEESLMTKQFPNQYPEYKKRTWALVPWVW